MVEAFNGASRDVLQTPPLFRSVREDAEATLHRFHVTGIYNPRSFRSPPLGTSKQPLQDDEELAPNS